MNNLGKKTLIIAAVMGLVALGGWGGRKAYRRWTAERLVGQARDYVAKADHRGALLSLQRALQLNPSHLEGTRAMADLLEQTGFPTAVGWRARVAQLEPGNPENRFAWAQTALRTRDLASARQALSAVDPAVHTHARFHKLSGALAWASARPTEAEAHFAAALRLEPTNQLAQLNLATVQLLHPETNLATAARRTLEAFAANPELRAPALRHLLADATQRQDFTGALTWSHRLIALTNAAFEDRLEHAGLLRVTQHADHLGYVARLQKEAESSSPRAAALGAYLLSTSGPTNALAWLQHLPPAIRTNLPVPLIVSDCLVALQDWAALLETLGKQDWDQYDYYRWALSSLAERSQGWAVAAQASWRKAARLSARRLDRLQRLAQITALWGWNNEQREVLRELVTAFPKEKWAVNALTTVFYANGETRAIRDLLAKAVAANPEDVTLKNNLASIYLLFPADLDKAHRLAREAHAAAPEDPFCLSTHAYSLFLQGKTAEALQLIVTLKPEFLEVPSVAAYYGAIQVEAGQRALAAPALELAAKGRLLPEEQEIVRRARARL